MPTRGTDSSASFAVRPAGRIWYALTALAALAGIAIETVLATGDPRFGSVLARVANLFTYFTMQSNVLVLVTATLVASSRARDALWFRALFVATLLAISITAIVFHAALADLLGSLTGAAALGNTLVHVVSPALLVSGWLLYGPRGVLEPRAVLLSLVFPLAWLTFTLIRGALENYYPYPFMDIAELGYARTAANLGIVVALALLLALAFAGLDRVSARLQHSR